MEWVFDTAELRSTPVKRINNLVTFTAPHLLRQPGIEPGSTAWEAAMITITPLSRVENLIYQEKF